MRDLLEFLVIQFKDNKRVPIEDAITKLGLTGRVVDVRSIQTSPAITDETKAAVFLRQAMPGAMPCPLCGGLLDPNKSSTYDHIKRIREGGSGDETNIQLVHPYCNDGYKN